MSDIDYSTFLFARPTFLEGFGRIVDFGNSLNVYNESETGTQADNVALRMDFQAVALDLQRAIEERVHGQTQQVKKQ